MNTWREKEIDDLLSQINDLKNIDELHSMFNKIFTPREINDAAKRLAIIKMLEAGDSYSTISMKLGVSPSTIGKISIGIGYGFRRTNNLALSKIQPGKSTKTPHIVKAGIRYKGVPTYKIKLK